MTHDCRAVHATGLARQYSSQFEGSMTTTWMGFHRGLGHQDLTNTSIFTGTQFCLPRDMSLWYMHLIYIYCTIQSKLPHAGTNIKDY